jgi:hypothetical protein
LTRPATLAILLCYDGSDGSRRAIKTAGALFPGREAIALHVWSPVAVLAAAYAGAVSLPTYDDTELQQAALELSEDGTRAAVDAGLAAKPAIAEVTDEGTCHAILDAASQSPCCSARCRTASLSTPIVRC